MKYGITVVAMALLVPSCSRKETGPAGTVKAFLTAQAAGDEEAILTHLQQADREFLRKVRRTKSGQSVFKLAEGASWTIGAERRDGERAVVPIVVTHNGKQTEQTMTLVRENGAWKIDIVPDEMIRTIESVITPSARAIEAKSGNIPGMRSPAAELSQ